VNQSLTILSFGIGIFAEKSLDASGQLKTDGQAVFVGVLARCRRAPAETPERAAIVAFFLKGVPLAHRFINV
jgi:hypothetical protein